MNEKIIGLNALKEYDEQLQEAYIKPLEKNIKELENAIIGGGGSSSVEIQSDWNQTDETKLDYIKNKPNLAPIAKSGRIEDLDMAWDSLIIFDGGDADVVVAKLDESILA